MQAPRRSSHASYRIARPLRLYFEGSRKSARNPYQRKTAPTHGFFFGDTTNREYYLSDLKDTVEKLDAALKEYSEEDGWEFEYRSSW